MTQIPEKYILSIQTILEWHWKAYKHDFIADKCICRVLDRIYKQSVVEVNSDELYFLDDCISDATNNVSECGVDDDLVWEMHSWVKAERNKSGA